MTRSLRSIGQSGEHLAARLLQTKGFQIRNVGWHAGRYGEIDLIAYHPEHDLLVFAEVKTRRTTRFGTPLDAVNPRKQAQLLMLAETYLSAHPQNPGTCFRFDVIGILESNEQRSTEVFHVEDAFRAE